MTKLPKIVREIGDALAKGGFNDLSPKAQAWVVDRINEHGYAPEIQNLGGLRDASFGAFAVGMGSAAPPYARTSMGAGRVSPVDYVRNIVDPPPFDEDDLIEGLEEFDLTGHEDFHAIFDTTPEREPELDDDGYPIEPWRAAIGDEDFPTDPWYLPLTPLSGAELDVGAGTWSLPAGCGGPTPLKKFAFKSMRDAYVAQYCGTSPLAQQSLAQQQALLAQQQLAAQAQALAPPAPAVDPMMLMAQMQQMQAMTQMMNPQASPAPALAPAVAPQAAPQAPITTDTGTPTPAAKPHHHKKGLFKRIEDFFMGDDDAPDASASDPNVKGGDWFSNQTPNAPSQQTTTQTTTQTSTTKPKQQTIYYLQPTCDGKRFPYTAAPGSQVAAQKLKAAYEVQHCQGVPGYNGTPAYTPPSYDPGPMPQATFAPAPAPTDPMTLMAEMQMLQSLSAPQAPAAPAYAPPPAPTNTSTLVPADTSTPVPKHKSLFRRIEDFLLGDEDDTSATPPTGATAIEHGSPEATRLAIARERAIAVQNIRGVATFASLELGAAALVDVARRVTAEPTAPAPGLVVGSWLDSVYDVATNPLVSPAGWLVKKGTEWYAGPSSEATATYQGLRADWAGYEAQGVAKYPDLGQDIAEWNLFKTQWEAGTIPNDEIGGRLTGEVLRSNRVRADLVQKQTGKFTAPQDLPPGDLRQGLDVTQSTHALKDAAHVDAVAQKIPIVNDITKPSNTPGTGTPSAPGVLGKLLWYTAAAAAAGTVLVVAKDVAVARMSK